MTCAIVIQPGYAALAEQAEQLIEPDDRSTRRLLRWPILSLEGSAVGRHDGAGRRMAGSIDDGDDIGRIRYAEQARAPSGDAG